MKWGTAPRPLLVAAVTLLALLTIGCAAAPTAESLSTVSPPVRARTGPPSAATPTPVIITTAPTSSVPSPSASPPAEGAAVIAAFISEFGQRQPPFHVDGDISMTGSAGSESIDVSIEVNGDVSGQDFDGEVVIPGRGTVRVRYVDGVGYARIRGGKWKRVPGVVQKQPTNPFVLLDSADVSYVGKFERGRRSLHQLRTNKWIGADFEEQGFTNVDFVSNEFNIYVSKKGIPVEAVLDAAVAATFEGRQVRFEYHVVYRFSDVGEPVDIRAPV